MTGPAERGAPALSCNALRCVPGHRVCLDCRSCDATYTACSPSECAALRLQVPLEEIPGAMAKCAAASTAGLSATVRSKEHACGLQLSLPDSTVVSAWRDRSQESNELENSRACIAPPDALSAAVGTSACWEDLQWAFATAAAAHVATASRHALECFASRISELHIPQDHPLVACAAVALEDALEQPSTHAASFRGQLLGADVPFKQLARLSQSLAWAGLTTAKSMSVLSREALTRLQNDPPRGAMMLADGALQFANAGAPTRNAGDRCPDEL